MRNLAYYVYYDFTLIYFFSLLHFINFRQYEQKLAEYQKHIAPYKETKEVVIQNGGASIQDGANPAQNGDTQEYRFGNEELIQEYNYQGTNNIHT